MKLVQVTVVLVTMSATAGAPARWRTTYAKSAPPVDRRKLHDSHVARVPLAKANPQFL